MANKVKIITDSCSDLTTELMEKYNIDYCKMTTILDEVVSPADLSWTSEDVHKFYNIIRGGKRIKTTQVPVDEFNRVFRQYLAEEYDIVYIGCSLKQSSSVNTAAVIAKELKAEYPNQTIYSIDSKNACMGEGMLAMFAAQKVMEGKNAEEVVELVNANMKKINEYITVHTLDHLKKAGRVKAGAAFFGNLMGIKPIIIADLYGYQSGFKKVKGRLNSLKEIVNLLKETIVNPEEQTIYLVHADCSDEEVNQLKAFIKEAIPCKDIYVSYIGPIIGASVGPDAIGVYGWGKDVTFSVGAE